MRSRSLLAARSRHPTQVRSGQARACVRPDILKSTSPCRPHPFGARVEHSLAKKTRLISVPAVVPRRRTSPHVAGPGRARAEPAVSGPPRPTMAADGRRAVSDGRMPVHRRTAPRGPPRTARDVRDVRGDRRAVRGRTSHRTARGSRRLSTTYGACSRLIRRSPPSRPSAPVPRCARGAPRQPSSPRGDRPAAAPVSSAPSVCSVSGRMSMRQPVRRAARRAFCPSLPIASDSW